MILKVVIDGDHAVQQSQDGEADQVRVDGGPEKVELSQEARGGGESGEREQEHGKAGGHAGPHIGQPFVVLDLDKRSPFPARCAIKMKAPTFISA